MENNAGKKTKGQRNIEIKKMENKTRLQVAFTKRRVSLFKKASELCILCGAEIAILARSPAGKVFAFGNPSVETLIHSFQMGAASALELGTSSRDQKLREMRSSYEEAERKLETEKRILKRKDSELWWDEPFEDMELHELEEYVGALFGLRDTVVHRVEEMEKLKLSASASTSSNMLGFTLGFPHHYDLQAVGFDVDQGLGLEAADHNQAQMEKSSGLGYSSNILMGPTDEVYQNFCYDFEDPRSL